MSALQFDELLRFDGPQGVVVVAHDGSLWEQVSAGKASARWVCMRTSTSEREARRVLAARHAALVAAARGYLECASGTRAANKSRSAARARLLAELDGEGAG